MNNIAKFALAVSIAAFLITTSLAQDNGLLCSEKLIQFYDNDIKIKQCKSTTRPTKPPHICSASITISRKNIIIKKFEYPDIDAVGWWYGVFLPKRQESKDHFILFKYGDYDSRTIIVSKNGKIFDFGGGAYKIIGGRYLITTHHEDDVTGFTFLDLAKNRVIISTDGNERFINLYESEKLYYVKMAKFIKIDNVRWKEKFLYYKLNLEEGRLIPINQNPNIFKVNNLIKVDLSNINYKIDCECR